MKSRKIINGLIFLLVGLILLANTLGMLDWSVWHNVVKLWPILLVSAGLSMIFRERGLSFLGPLLIFLAIIVGVWTSYSDFGLIPEVIPQEKVLSREIIPETVQPLTKDISSEIEMPTTSESTSTNEQETERETPLKKTIAPETTKAFIDIKFDLGTLTINNSTSQLYECIAKYRHKEFEPFEKYSVSNGDIYINISHAPISRSFFSSNVNNKWLLKLNKNIIYNLQISSGAINMDCDLSGLMIDKLFIESGASNLHLILPSFNTKVMVDTGVSNIDIDIPGNVGTMVTMDTGIAMKDLDDFIRDNNIYNSKNYNDTEYKANIELDCGVSNININYI